jgi:hypothetical protein
VSGDGLALETVIEDPAADPRNPFGYDCAIDGNRLAINSIDLHNVWIYEYIDGAWQPTGGLTPEVVGPIGSSQSLDGDVLLVGGPLDERRGIEAGAAYVFRRGSDSMWQQEATLFAPDSRKDARFGWSVSLSGNVALIGAYRDSEAGEAAGAAYIFRYDGSAWNFEAKFLPESDGDFMYFGGSVALEGSTAVIGAPSEGVGGTVSIYGFDGSGWVREARFASSTFGVLGTDVSIAGGIVAAADPTDDEIAEDAGVVRVYRKASGAWAEVSRVYDPDAGFRDGFGSPLALSEGFLAGR